MLWQTHGIKYEIIEIQFDLHHQLHNKQKRSEIWTTGFLVFKP